MHVDSLSASDPISIDMTPALLIDPSDNLVVALRDLKAGETISVADQEVEILEAISAKHKFPLHDLASGDRATMYGVTVGIARESIAAGTLTHMGNLAHDADSFSDAGRVAMKWTPPKVEAWTNESFNGYHRDDGQVGTANHWLVIPMVFCETRNVNAIRAAFEKTLGYAKTTHYERLAASLVAAHHQGASTEGLKEIELEASPLPGGDRVFPNVDGIQFLTHSLGCGGTREDAEALCGLLAGYITHPNVAGATVLSLGCENAQLEILEAAIQSRDSGFSKPLFTFRQQAYPNERTLLDAAIKETFIGLREANNTERQPAPLNRLCLGVECGGSDGFSGISANPALGAVSDRLVALGGRVILSEFPELCGVEQELVNRCVTDAVAKRFVQLTSAYADRARAVGSDFSQNPSPGNIKDGLITDAIKSAGAAKKGGTSPIVAALDYPEVATESGLNLLCTPGGDVESTTAMAGAHANLIVFTTGLGTPTGNPVCPVLKVSSNTELAERLPDLIDFDCGTIIRGEKSVDEIAEAMLEQLVRIASGEELTKAQVLGQNDFQPWKRGVSL